MPRMSPADQRQRLSSLITGITHQYGAQAATVARAEAVTLSIEEAILLLELVFAGAEGADAGAVSDLSALGYESAEQVLAVSQLVEGSTPRRTVPIIVALGLSQERSEVLLGLSPDGLRLLSMFEDKAWRRAMRLLPEQVLGECIRSAGSQTVLWTSVVAAQDGHMAKRIAEFRAAGRPYLPWIVSGHSPEALEGAVPLSCKGRALTRAEVHRAVRSLDRAEVPDGPE